MRASRQIELARDGRVTAANYQRLGYSRVFPGAYAPAEHGDVSDEWERLVAAARVRAHAALAVMEDRDFVLHSVSALPAIGVALPHRLYDWDNCHIEVRAGASRLRKRGIVTHETRRRRELRFLADGLPVLHPIVHWTQLRQATVDELVEVGDGLVRRRHPLVSPLEFHQHVDSASWVPGIRNCRAALQLIVPGTDSIYETRLRLVLVRAGLPVPAVNHRVVVRSAGRVFFLDMAYRAERLAIEFDGLGHVGSRSQMAQDVERRRLLNEDGWLVLTFTADDLRCPERVVAAVEAALVMRRAALQLGR